MYNITKEFKENLYNLRKENNLNQENLSKILDVSQSCISQWELGKKEPTLSNIIKICKYFGISADDLLGL